ncbi:MAG TPA: HAMP domain-containing sensor histidine kinase, partial [Cytophagaceae bacterium]
MNFLSKIITFSTFSKLLIISIFIIALPFILQIISLHNTDRSLLKKKDVVVQLIKKEGIENYIDNENSTYGSYNILKEEYISLELIDDTCEFFEIENTKRLMEGETFDFRVLSYAFKEGGDCYLLEIGTSLGSMDALKTILQKYTFYLLLLLVGITAIIEIAYTRFLLTPFQKIIREKLFDIAHPNTFRPSHIATSTSDFKRLDKSINDMMIRIRTAFEREKEFISNVSHELLTPVSIIQNKLENLLNDPTLSKSGSLKVVESLKTVNRFKNIIKNLLLISKIENEQFLKNEQVEMPQLLKEVVEEASDRAEMKNITLHLDVKANLIVANVNKPLLFILLNNVVNNAIKYNREYGIVSVKLLKEASGYVI